jgi:hypothetical protein
MVAPDGIPLPSNATVLPRLLSLGSKLMARDGMVSVPVPVRFELSVTSSS